MRYGEANTVEVPVARDAGNFARIRRGREHGFFRDLRRSFGKRAGRDNLDHIAARRIRNDGDYARKASR
jgi:hypothetical protein